MFVLTKQGNRHLVCAGFVASRKKGCLLSAQIWAQLHFRDSLTSSLVKNKGYRPDSGVASLKSDGKFTQLTESVIVTK